MKLIENDIYHPHLEKRQLEVKNNTIYEADDNLSFMDLSGAGTFNYSPKLKLTKDGMSSSRWALPDSFRALNISYHTGTAYGFKENYFQSAGKGQEFVIEESPIAEEWAKGMIIPPPHLPPNIPLFSTLIKFLL